MAISTRVAPSFLRVGQVELFGRRARKNEHPEALKELEQIMLHVISREYPNDIDSDLASTEKVLQLAKGYRARLTSLVSRWMRVGYCQGNFNSDNCTVGGFTLDYGPFGFCEAFDPYFQPWTGGGQHFSFWNQPTAAERNFGMLCQALTPLLGNDQDLLQQLQEIQDDFLVVMQSSLEKMWCAKTGLDQFDSSLLNDMIQLMMQTPVDYTIFFRELSSIPEDITPLKRSFYQQPQPELEQHWSSWLAQWRATLVRQVDSGSGSCSSLAEISERMKRVNPKYILREWHLVPAYQQAAKGDYSLIRELQEVMTQPYAEQSQAIEQKFYQLRPLGYDNLGGLAHMSCSS